MKKILILILALALMLAFAACSDKTTDTPDTSADTPSDAGTAADDDWAYIQGKGTLVIGITEYEPMNYYDADGKLVGFDTEFAEALCAKLGLTPDFVVIDWDSKELELESKNIDCIWNGLTVSEERKANMDFTASYLANRQVVVIRSADAGTYVDLAAFAGVPVVAEGGSAGETAVAADLPEAAYTAVNAQSDALLEVKAGTAAAAVVDYTMAKSMVGEGTDYADLMIVDSIEMMDEEYAVGLRNGSAAVAVFDGAIGELIADGTLANLAEKYNLSDLLISK